MRIHWQTIHDKRRHADVSHDLPVAFAHTEQPKCVQFFPRTSHQTDITIIRLEYLTLINSDPWRNRSAVHQFETRCPALDSGVAHGRVTVNVEPAPSSLSTVIVPPWATTIDRAMYNPRPSPP